MAWVGSEEAVEYKTQIAEMLESDAVFCMQQKDELQPLLAALGK